MFDPQQQASDMRNQGLPDSVVNEELSRQGYSAPAAQPAFSQPPAQDTSIYERIEQITEAMIDEKWDDLIGEVRKILEWKSSLEQKQAKLQHDLDKLKEDFKTLHQGVLGKLQTYDERMRDVGTELDAVGKVFKDVVPEFVENVKELGSLVEKKKK